MDPNAYYHFSNSVWIASFWVGVAPIAESVAILMLLMANTVLQLYFCVLLVMNMGNRAHMGIEDNDLRGLLSWRTTAAHDFKNYDANTNTSLAARVCGSWSAAIVSSDQMGAHESFASYVGDVGVVWGGPGLCMVCLICWFSLLAVDVRDNLHCSVAMWSHWTRGLPTHVHRNRKGAFQFRQLGTRRIVLIHAIGVFPRFAIAIMLLFAGARFLIYTQSRIELILNAIALGFILELDELTFDFLPETIRTAVARTDAMKMSSNSRFRWMFLKTKLPRPQNPPTLETPPATPHTHTKS